jgi:hypothetical protein
MVSRPRDLAERMAGRRKPDDGYLRETFSLPRDQARTKARDFLARYPKAAYMSGVESWRELPARSNSRCGGCAAPTSFLFEHDSPRKRFAFVARENRYPPRIKCGAGFFRIML